MERSRLLKFCLLMGVLVMFTLLSSIPVMAVPIEVETAYLFALPHGGGGPDGGSVRLTNLSATDNVDISSVFISGWTSGQTFEWAPYGPATLTPGVSGQYNQAFPPYLGDTSNYGTLTCPACGVTVTVAGTFQGASFSQSYYDNIQYAITGGVNTGADVEGPCCQGIPYGRTTPVPEPSSLLLLGSGLAGLGLWRRFKARS